MMHGEASAVWVAKVDGQASFCGGLTSSPCRSCHHFKDGTERTECRHEPDCLLGDISPRVGARKEPKRKRRDLVRCAFPGCKEETRSETGMCVKCNNTVRYRTRRGWPKERLFAPKRKTCRS